MITKRRRSGRSSRNSSSRLPARIGLWIDSPVTLAPGRLRLATRPSRTGRFRSRTRSGSSWSRPLRHVPHPLCRQSRRLAGEPGRRSAPTIGRDYCLPSRARSPRSALRRSRLHSSPSETRHEMRHVGERPAAHEADHRHGRLLRPRRERPCHRAAEQRHELPTRHSMTSSARASSVGGAVRPSALAVLRLITNSSLEGSSIGRSPGRVPFKIRSTK
jgi:hypothetical protein